MTALKLQLELHLATLFNNTLYDVLGQLLPKSTWLKNGWLIHSDYVRSSEPMAGGRYNYTLTCCVYNREQLMRLLKTHVDITNGMDEANVVFVPGVAGFQEVFKYQPYKGYPNYYLVEFLAVRDYPAILQNIAMVVRAFEQGITRRMRDLSFTHTLEQEKLSPYLTLNS